MDATERCSSIAASFSNCLISADVRMDKVSSFRRFMVLHLNGLVLQMYCVLRMSDALPFSEPQLGEKLGLFTNRESCQLMTNGLNTDKLATRLTTDGSQR